MNTDRLLHLAEILDGILPECFELPRSLVCTPPKHRGDAVSYACDDPILQDLGLSMDWNGPVYTNRRRDGTPFVRLFWGRFMYRGWPAIAAFFGISEDEAHHLFTLAYGPGDPEDPKLYLTARECAARIRSYVEQGGLL